MDKAHRLIVSDSRVFKLIAIRRASYVNWTLSSIEIIALSCSLYRKHFPPADGDKLMRFVHVMYTWITVDFPRFSSKPADLTQRTCS